MLPVDPVPHEWEAAGGFALGALVFVVRKHVVHTAGVDVELRAEIFGAHRAALDVPTRESAAPRTLPGHDAPLLGFLPERKVLRRALQRIQLAGRVLSLAQELEQIAAESPVIGEGLDREEHVAADAIGVATL